MSKQPRHAIYYDTRFGRNDGPPLYYFNVLKHQLKLDVMHLLPQGDTSQYGKFDYHWWIDWGEDALPWQEWYPPKDGGKTIYVASDTHLDNGYRLEKAKKFDYVFFNQHKAFKQYTGWNLVNPNDPSTFNPNQTQPVTWLPHAAEPQAYPHTVQAKKYDVCFIGHLTDDPNVHGMTRVETLDRVFKAFPNFYFGTRNPQKPEINMFEDAARKYNQSRIVLNHCVRDDGLNMRFFEVLSSGAFLLTSRTHAAYSIGLKEGADFAAYDSYDELMKKISYYLEHKDEREKIALSGHKAFNVSHQYKHRVMKILSIVGCL